MAAAGEAGWQQRWEREKQAARAEQNPGRYHEHGGPAGGHLVALMAGVAPWQRLMGAVIVRAVLERGGGEAMYKRDGGDATGQQLEIAAPPPSSSSSSSPFSFPSPPHSLSPPFLSPSPSPSLLPFLSLSQVAVVVLLLHLRLVAITTAKTPPPTLPYRAITSTTLPAVGILRWVLLSRSYCVKEKRTNLTISINPYPINTLYQLPTLSTYHTHPPSTNHPPQSLTTRWVFLPRITTEAKRGY